MLALPRLLGYFFGSGRPPRIAANNGTEAINPISHAPEWEENLIAKIAATNTMTEKTAIA